MWNFSTNCSPTTRLSRIYLFGSNHSPAFRHRAFRRPFLPKHCLPYCQSLPFSRRFGHFRQLHAPSVQIRCYRRSASFPTSRCHLKLTRSISGILHKLLLRRLLPKYPAHSSNSRFLAGYHLPAVPLRPFVRESTGAKKH